jgi:Escherichia/Staphylococcus phage prohead protease
MTETETLTTAQRVELRASSGNSRSIGGLAAVFNSESENLGGFVERVAPTFFNDSRADGWNGVVCRFEHDPNFLLGTVRSGTLQLSLDGTGLNYVVALPESRSDILELVERGDLGSSSFAFQTHEDQWGITDGGVALRTLVSGRLIDVAPVSSPAYVDTTVGLRSLARYKDVPIEDVMALSAQDELRKLFIRTDRPSPREPVVATRSLSGATAKLQTSAKSKPAMSGVAAKMRTLAKKHGRVSAA